MRDMRETFLPLLEAAGVDLVLSAHSHGYERSHLLAGHHEVSSRFDPARHLLDAGRTDERGVMVYRKGTRAGEPGALFAVVGSASERSRMGEHPVMVRRLSEMGSLALDFHNDYVEGVFVRANGAIRDHFRLERDPTVERALPGDVARGRSRALRATPAWLWPTIAVVLAGALAWGIRRRRHRFG